MSLLRENKPLFGDLVVLNTSSLSSLMKTNCIDILVSTFRRRLVPEEVSKEIKRRHQLPTGVEAWTLNAEQKDRARSFGLHLGESQAIVLARDLDAPLIMDDSPAQKVAEKLEVAVIGSVAFVKVAFEKCLLTSSDYQNRITAFERTHRVNIGIISWARHASKP